MDKENKFDRNKILEFKSNLTKQKLFVFFPEFECVSFDKYVRPTLNFINSRIKSSQTDKRHVGPLSDLFQKYLNSIKKNEEPTVNGWKNFYLNCDNVFLENQSIDRTILLKNIKRGQDVFNEACKNINNLISFLSNEIIGKKLTEEVVRMWVEDLMFTKTFQGLYVEKPIANFICKLLFAANDNVDQYNPEKLRKSSIQEESKGIDYVYADGNLVLFFQIKTGVSQADYLRKTSKAISSFPDDVYCCEYIRNEDKIKLVVRLNGRILLNI